MVSIKRNRLADFHGRLRRPTSNGVRLFLIRHGETDYTAQKRYCGSIDAPLNTIGIKQAQRLKKLLSKEKIDVVYTSPLLRVVQTADIIFAGRNIKIYKSPLLRESNLGKWEGLTLEEIKGQFPEDVERWYQDSLKFGATDGETPVILQRRVKRFLSRLKNNNIGSKPFGASLCQRQIRLWRKSKTIAVVTHSGPFRIIVGEISGNGLKDFWKSEPKTGECKIVNLCQRN